MRTAITAALCAALLPLTACQATPGDYSVIDTLGTNGRVSTMLLRNVHLLRPTDDTYHPGENATVYLTLINTASHTDRLVRVGTPQAAAVNMHWDRHCDGTAERVDEIPLLLNGTPPAPPGGEHIGHLPYHLEITDLNRLVRAGTTVPLTFTFAEAGTVTIDAMVQTHPLSEVGGARACSSDPRRSRGDDERLPATPAAPSRPVSAGEPKRQPSFLAGEQTGRVSGASGLHVTDQRTALDGDAECLPDPWGEPAEGDPEERVGGAAVGEELLGDVDGRLGGDHEADRHRARGGRDVGLVDARTFSLGQQTEVLVALVASHEPTAKRWVWSTAPPGGRAAVQEAQAGQDGNT